MEGRNAPLELLALVSDPGAPAALLWLADHDLGGLDEGKGRIAGFEGEVVDGIRGDDGGDALGSDGENDLGEEAFDDDFDDSSGELIASADARGAGVGGGGRQELLQGFSGDAMVAAGGLDGADAAGEDPVLECGVADAEPCGGLPRCEERGIHLNVICLRQYCTRFSPQRRRPDCWGEQCFLQSRCGIWSRGTP